MSARIPHALILAGGTGGHVFPALALAETLRTRGWQVSWLGTSQGIEARLVPAAGIPLHTLPVVGFRGKRLMNRLVVPWRLGLSLWSALALLLRLRPQVVIGFGGFAAGPGGLMAAALGRPLFIHEQNAFAGTTNRWLAKVADQVFAAFPESFPETVAVRHVGNPVRAGIAALPPPAERWRERAGPLRLLVLGGSLGALSLNQAVPAALAALPDRAAFQVRHQTGERTHAQALAAYEEAGVEAEISTFIPDMASAYAWADLVVCRAGALTIAELAAAGLPAILVPYPHATDDHQTANAQYLVSAGAAWLIPDADLTPERLLGLLHGLSREACLQRAQYARAVALTDAAEKMADACVQALPVKWRGQL